jgi:putative peptidoglycan lipid II flippase
MLPGQGAQGSLVRVPNVCRMSPESPDPDRSAIEPVDDSDATAGDTHETSAALRGQAHRRHLARSTAVFAFATGLSRVLGLVREMVAAYFFGVTGLINAFTVAFQIPNLVRALVADAALSGAFVPIFSGLLESGDRRRAWRVASTIFWLVLLGTTALTALLILLTPLLIRPFGDPGGDAELAVALARIMFPIVVLLGITGVVVGILNAYDQFTIPALTPVVWNAVIIAGLAVGVPATDGEEAGLYVYAGSIVIATLVQFLMPLPALRGLDGRIRPVLDWRDPAVRRFFALMLPVTVTLGLINVNALIGTLFASRLIDPELAPAAIDKAFRLYMLPQGMFSVAVATVLFPTLSRLAARGDRAGFRRTIDEGLRLIGFLLIPASLVAAVLAVPITRLVYERGAFTAEDTDIVAGCLAAYSLGLVFNGWMLMLMRGFYALQSNWAPTLVALGSLAANVVLNTTFYRLGVWGLPLATSVANVLGVAALLVLLRRRVGVEHPGRTIGALGRILLVSIAATAVAAGVWALIDRALGRGVGAQVVALAAAFGVGTAAFLFGSRIGGVREVRALLALRPRKD